MAPFHWRQCCILVVSSALLVASAPGSSKVPAGTPTVPPRARLRVAFLDYFLGNPMSGPWFIKEPGSELSFMVFSTEKLEINVSVELEELSDRLKFLNFYCFDIDSADRPCRCQNFTMTTNQRYVVRVNFSTNIFDSGVIANIHATLQVKGAEIISSSRPVVILDTRKLHVGFMENKMEMEGGSIRRDGSVTRNGSISIHVAALDDSISLAGSLKLQVNLTSSDATETYPVTIEPHDTKPRPVTFGGLDPALTYTASLSILSSELANYVTLGDPIQREVSVAELFNLVYYLQQEIFDLRKNLTDKIAVIELQNNVIQPFSSSSATTTPSTATPLPAATTTPKATTPLPGDATTTPLPGDATTTPKATTPLPGDATTTPEATTPLPDDATTTPEALPDDATTTADATLPAATATSKCSRWCVGNHTICNESIGQCVCMSGFRNQTGSCVKITMTGVPCSDGKCDDEHAECEKSSSTCQCKEGFAMESNQCVVGSDGIGSFWWLLFGFAAVVVVIVGVYIVFSHRDKVQVYVVKWWKGSDNGRTLSLKTKGRKYTPLPTNIHETLTHED